MRRSWSLALLALGTADGFYLPGVAPHDFQRGERVELKVNKLSSTRTQIPYEYYSLPFCRPLSGVVMSAENLGEFLSGDRIDNSPYRLYMRDDSFCNILCQKKYTKEEAGAFKKAIAEEYHHNWIIDNLPAATVLDTDEYITTSYSRGFPVGYMDTAKRAYLYNHVNIIIKYHELSPDENRVVGFYVEPFSVKHQFMNGAIWSGSFYEIPPLATCDKTQPMDLKSIYEEQRVEAGTVLFTYDVVWRPSNIHWASRWDIYLSMDNAVPAKVHWFSIINSVLIVVFLSSMILMILVRNVHRDISQYNRVLTPEEKEEEREESGWKLVHTDVFRPPTTCPLLFCVFVGTGLQVLWMAVFTLAFAALGFLSPANRGSLMVAMLLLYVVMGAVAGFKSANLYKTFRGKNWQRCTLLTALLFPGVSFAIFFTFNMVLSSYGSSGAVPLLSMAAIVALWFGISVPLVFLGAYVGFRKDVMEFPIHPRGTVAPRPIPEQKWYLGLPATVLLGGILPFGACFVELFFILSSMWMDQYYYVFGFLALVFVILLVTCAEISVVLCYFQLCAEDYHWWWRSFLTAGSTAVYVFLYSAFYFSKLEANLAITYFLYFGYMSIVSFGLFLVTGLTGFTACLWFTRKIYGSIKVD